MTKPIKIIDTIQSQFKGNYAIFAFMIMGIFIFLIQYSKSQQNTEQTNPEKDESIDTIIPRGYVLVPIEITNSESLQSLINGKAVVDLYLSTKSGNRSRHQAVGKHLKLIQAPLNPDRYAVLVKESESKDFMLYDGPFFAVIQNPSIVGEKLQFQSKPKNKLNIDYHTTSFRSLEEDIKE